MVEGCLGAQGHNGKLVGTAGLYVVGSQVAEVGIVLDDLVLDIGALVVNELEDLIRGGTGQGSLLGT